MSHLTMKQSPLSMPGRLHAPGTPWMIREDAFRSILSRSPMSLSVPEGYPKIKSMGRARSDNEDGPSSGDSDGYCIQDGVAIIPVYGPIYRHSSYVNDFMAFLFGGVSVDSLCDSFTHAADNSAVRAIMMTCDSPGGEAAGIGELAGLIREISQIKPTAAYCESFCASACYYLASATGEITAAPAAWIGCIGTVICLEDDSKFEDIIGIKDIPVVSSQTPRKWPDITTDEGIHEYQLLVNAMADVFITDVAKYRGVSKDDVLKNFGQGACFLGKEAKAAGMIDKIGTAADVMRKLSGPGRNRLAISSPAASSSLAPVSLSSQPQRAPIRIGARLSHRRI